MLRSILVCLLAFGFTTQAWCEEHGGFTGRVVSAEGRPIADVLVYLPGNDDKVLAEARTDREGRFDLNITLEENRYLHRHGFSLVITADEYGTTSVDSRHLTLFPNAKKDLGDIVLDRAPCYTGRVVDSHGNPIAGAKVICGSFVYLIGYGTVSPVGKDVVLTTDSQGLFKTPYLSTGQPFIEAQAKGYVRNYHNPKEIQSLTRECQLPDLVLRQSKPIHGRLLDEAGKPIANQLVNASGVITTTDEEGNFVLDGFAADAHFQLVIYKDGYVGINWGVDAKPDGFAYYEIYSLPDADNFDEAEKNKQDATVRIPRLDLTLVRESSIKGKVVDAETGEPINISKIILCTFVRKDDGEVVLSGCRSSEMQQPRPGEFSIAYWTPTEYHLTVKAEGYEDGEAFTPLITARQTVDGIVVKMKRLAQAETKESPFVQTVSGAVLNHAQYGGNVRVALWRVPKPEGMSWAPLVRGRVTAGDGSVVASTAVDAKGRYALDVRYQADDWYLLAETPQGVVAVEGPIKIEKGQQKSVDLIGKQLGSLQGNVINPSAATDPLYAILFSDLGVIYEARVKADGSFKFDNVYPGVYGLKVGHNKVVDTEVPDFRELNVSRREMFDQSHKPFQPWARARHVEIGDGPNVDQVSVTFEP